MTEYKVRIDDMLSTNVILFFKYVCITYIHDIGDMPVDHKNTDVLQVQFNDNYNIHKAHLLMFTVSE